MASHCALLATSEPCGGNNTARQVRRAPRAVPVACGFMHWPCPPSQLAELLAGTRRERRYEPHRRAGLAPMDLAPVDLATAAPAETALAIALASDKAG